MTVAKLIAILKTMPQDRQVYMAVYDSGQRELRHINTITVEDREKDCEKTASLVVDPIETGE